MADRAVLVTRPAGQADSLCRLLEQSGYRPLHCPMLELEALTGPEPNNRARLQQLDEYQILIFVSANAVSFGMAWIEDYWLQFPTGPRCLSVGQASAELLRSYRLKVEFPVDNMSSEGLLALPSLLDVEGQRILIFKGEGGRDYLRTELLKRGASVDELVTYRRRPPAMAVGQLFALLQANDCHRLLISSGEGLHNMVSLLTASELEQVLPRQIVVPGGRVTGEAAALGFSRITTAANATDEAMMTALRQVGADGVKQ